MEPPSPAPPPPFSPSAPLLTPSSPPTRRNRLSSFHIPQRSPTHARTPLRPSNVRISSAFTPLRSTALPVPNAAATPKQVERRRSRRQSRRQSTRRPQMSQEELVQMYSSTIKLCQDNKINARNTWTLNLIDYMPMLFKTADKQPAQRVVSFPGPREVEEHADTNFQLAGVTLDAGVRIYCSRVDSVHTNAFKVLGGLSRTGGRQDVDGEEGSGEEEGDGDNERERGRRRRAKRTGRSTLETNVANITSQKLETDLAVDPLFQKMSAAFDEGGAKGMLLNNLPVGPKGQVIFDSGELADDLVQSDEEGGSEVYDVTDLLPSEAPIETDIICGSFLRFYHAKRSMLEAAGSSSAKDTGDDVRSAVMQRSSYADESIPPSDPAVDFEYSNDDLQNAEALGVFAGAEFNEDSLMGNSNFGQDNADDDDDVNVFGDRSSFAGRESLGSSASFAIAARRGSLDLVEAGVAFSDDSEYAFFDSSKIPGWAGPQHWRFRAAQTSVSSSTVATNGRKPKRPRGKTAMLLDFSSEAPKINFAKEFAQGKTESSYHLSDSVKGGFSEKKVTLPEDLHFSVRSLTSLFLKPRTSVRTKKVHREQSKVGTDDNTNESWYDFDNDCDNDNFCPNEYGDSGGDKQLFGPEESITTELDLIPEPTKVDKVDINYARVAKKVDVRQLKSGMWSRLCGRHDPSAVVPGDDHKNEPKNAEEVDLSPSENSTIDIRDGRSQTLQEVVHQLPSVVPETSLTDVSLPYVFICLLHLANEKTLTISQNKDGSLSDLIITASSQQPK